MTSLICRSRACRGHSGGGDWRAAVDGADSGRTADSGETEMGKMGIIGNVGQRKIGFDWL
jgi:hypothetical protein